MDRLPLLAVSRPPRVHDYFDGVRGNDPGDSTRPHSHADFRARQPVLEQRTFPLFELRPQESDDGA